MWPGPDVGRVVEALIAAVAGDASVTGVLLGPPSGRNTSFVTDATLYVVLADEAVPAQRWSHDLAERIGTSSGVIDHNVRLISCLYRTPALHVALAVVRRDGVSRIRRPVRVMWQRDAQPGSTAQHQPLDVPDGRPPQPMARAMPGRAPVERPRPQDGMVRRRPMPGRDLQRGMPMQLGRRRPLAGAPAAPEDRGTQQRGRGRLLYSATAGDALFWILLHSAIRKAHRGELFEAIKLLDSARTTRLAPLAGLADGRLGAGACRWFERLHPVWIEPFGRTVAAYGRESCLRACGEAVRLYADLYARAVPESAADAAVVAAAVSHFLDAGDSASPDDSRDLPHHVAAFLASAMPAFEAELDVLGVGVTGAWTHDPGTPARGRLDRHSDLDLAVLVPPARRRDVEWQKALATQLARCYVLQRRKDECIMGLYGDPLVHVDTMFYTADALKARFENPVVLWERDGRFSDALRGSAPDPVAQSQWPQATPQSIESQVWKALLDCTTRLRRGELFQAIYDLARVRSTSLGPLAALVAGEPCRGVRRLELRHPELVDRFAATIPPYDAEGCWRAIESSIALYRDLRQLVSGPSAFRSKVEQPLAAWLQSFY